MRLKKKVKYALAAIAICAVAICILIMNKKQTNTQNNTNTVEEMTETNKPDTSAAENNDNSSQNQPVADGADISPDFEGLDVVEEVQLDSGDSEHTDEVGG